MQTVRVSFRDVGPSHKSWDAELPAPLTAHSMIRSIKKNHALGSREIDFHDNGGIYVGMFRRVGSFEIHDQPAATEEKA